MDICARVQGLIEPTLASMGYGIVRIAMIGSAKKPVLQIMAERTDGQGMGAEDCEQISHAISAQLDVADPIASAYTLEVSSPGIDRPLTRLADFSRFAGYEAKIQLRTPRGAQRNFKGVLRGTEEDNVILECYAGKEEGMRKEILPFAEIESAKLIMTDALLKAAIAGKISA